MPGKRLKNGDYEYKARINFNSRVPILEQIAKVIKEKELLEKYRKEAR